MLRPQRSHCSVWVFQLELFSEPDFQGDLVSVDHSTAALADGFVPRSCRVFSGR